MSTPAPSRLAVIGTVCFYMVAALSMVIANKWVLNATDVPLFFLFAQLIIAVLLFLVCHAVRLLTLPFDFSLELMKGLAPMIILNVLSLSFSNFTLKYVDASFYQIARGLVLPFTVLTSFVFLSARPSVLVLLACSIVTFGFLIGVFLDGVHVSAMGIFFGVASSAITAVHAVVIKKAMKLLDNSALKVGWYNNLLSSLIVLALSVAVGEGPKTLQLLTSPSETGILATFTYGSIVTGVVGFLMSIASMLSIKVTSPITHMVSSAVRGVAASVLGVWIFHDIITSGRAASIIVILGGSIYFTWVKHVESLNPPAGTTEKRRDEDEKGVGYKPVATEDLESGPSEQDQEKQ
ncbi:hypothetical protein SCHPADRAFT_902312 [Schizopora paradoxa]|uniref:Sugar phosphate transporter domain-containing protein n=1 Tax=Schizopora paradoxa TaxID=27342 RepID=A0A0H2S1C0_9AGAM|nr:hypothetical protein SCHPADRAFT_902312 [Schizopora paradoxa]